MITVDSSVWRGDDDGHEVFRAWRRRRSGLRRAWRERGCGRLQGEWTCGSSMSCVARGEGSGGARGDGSVVAVLGWLGGIPPSSLEARGRGRRPPCPFGPGGLARLV